MPNLYKGSLEEFTTKTNMPNVKNWCSYGISSMGYGDFTEVNAWHALEFIRPTMLLGMGFLSFPFDRSVLFSLECGFQGLCERMANDLIVHTNSQISKIGRTSNGVDVIFKGGSHEHFDSLIIGASLKQIERDSIINLKEEEKILSNSIKTINFSVAVCKVSEKRSNDVIIFDNFKKENDGRIFSFHHPAFSHNQTICYFNTRKSYTKDDIFENLKSDLSLLGHTLEEIHEVKEWEYFPHFDDPADLDLIENLQGRNSTYYVGSQTCFEGTESVAKYSYKLIDNNFSGKLKKEYFTLFRNLWFVIKARNND
jgi:hypothetical protein